MTSAVRPHDDRLVARAQSGDHAAFDVLVERHQTRLRRSLYRVLHDCDAAYDAVQEALTRAWLNIGRFEGRSQFSTWLTRIGINEACPQMERDLSRSAGREVELEIGVGERVADGGSLPMALRAELDAYFEGYA